MSRQLTRISNLFQIKLGKFFINWNKHSVTKLNRIQLTRIITELEFSIII